MRASISLLFAAATVSASQPAAQPGSAYTQWITRLVSSHINRDFCPPPDATYSSMIRDVDNYKKSHPAQKDDMTDSEWVDLLSTIYPCNHPAGLSSAEAAALGASPTGSVAGNYAVQPSGIYSTINTAQSNELLSVLRGPPSEEVERQVTLIKTHSGDYIPPVLMQMAIYQFNKGNIESAVFWFHAGLLRTILDVRLSADPSVSDAPTLMVRKTPLALVKAAISDDPKVVRVIQEVVAWDAKTPYDYDHRWIALHGVGATQSALDPTHAPTSLMVPASQWPTIIANNRSAYAGFVSRNVARVEAAQH